MGKHGFSHCEMMKNADTEWRFLGDYQKRLHFKFKHFSTFPQKMKNVLEKENLETFFWETRKVEKSATMSGKRIFHYFR